MKLHPEDPRLTAAALGELSREETEAIERAAANDPLLQVELAELRRIRKILTGTFAMPEEKLPAQHRDTILRTAREADRGGGLSFIRLPEWFHRLLIPTAAAAVLVLATIFLLKMPNNDAPSKTAHSSSPAKAPSGLVPARSAVTHAASPRHEASPAAQFPSLELPVEIGKNGLDAIRKSILDHRKPPAEVVRLEEILNTFSFSFNGITAVAPQAASWHPDTRDMGPGYHAATLTAEMIPCPWKPSATLLLISLRGNPHSDCEVKLSFNAATGNVARYRLLGFAPVTSGGSQDFPSKLKAGASTAIAIEIEPSGTADALGSLEWTTDGRPAPSISLVRKTDAEMSDDARFAALVCTFAQWLAGEQSAVIDQELVAALSRENTSPGLPADRAEFLVLLDRLLQL